MNHQRVERHTTETVLVTRRAEPTESGAVFAAEPVALVDLLDRVLARGVVVAGEVTLSIAGVDLVQVSLRALITSVRPDLYRGGGDG
ncbi:gas vesicle protein [Natronosporangium hydrolyticum]|uniref:Gas vesicle protein n=1 Tax=Natronosporangium hydrolyticum TaxID=2811111 RepID=A0A895YGH0_9ACTN|nr:gas vesicle protein [Natronosporangium hydrolyticum]QSB15192.1 gas vesicle protein [Natronosporangium hydrolyticum]